jgi:hypothetical protein
MSKYIYIIPVAIFVIILNSCAPVNFFTSVKRTPKYFVNNFYGEELRPWGYEYKKKNRGAWIVYSDRENNVATIAPGGNLTIYNAKFLEPFIVIKQKGDFLKLIKYDAKFASDLKIKKADKANYVGWMHKSKLILSNKTFSDRENGFKNKYIVAIKDTQITYNPKSYLADSDSYHYYFDANLSRIRGTAPLYEIVYRLKRSEDDRKSLISKVSILPNDSMNSKILGWVDNTILVNIGNRLHTNMTDSKSDSLIFTLISGDTIPKPPKIISELKTEIKYHKALSFDPVYIINNKGDSSFYFHTSFMQPVIDKTNNFVYNVNGSRIKYNDYLSQISALSHINVIFIIENGKNISNLMASIINSIQNLESVFKKYPRFNFKYGAVLPYGSKSEFGLVSDYTQMMGFLSKYTDKKNSASGNNPGNWKSLNKSLEMVRNNNDETNLLVILGENASTNEEIDASLANQLAKLNCRIMGFQLFNNTTNEANNFTLQLQDLIASYIENQTVSKRNKMVYTSQLRRQNVFKETGKNIYLLNFPDSSMTQGGIIFPEKNQFIDMNYIATFVDTITNFIVRDNTSLINNLNKAFLSIGNHYNQYTPAFKKEFSVPDSLSPSDEFTNSFVKDIPLWCSPFFGISAETKNIENNFMLLYSVSELQNIQEFMRKLYLKQVEYITNSESQKKSPKNQNYLNEFEQNISVFSEGKIIYKPTQKIRKYLYNYLYQQICSGKLKYLSILKFNRLTLGKTISLITSEPAINNKLLNTYSMNDLMLENKLPDPVLDSIIKYFKQKSDLFSASLNSFEKFLSNNELYYWINPKLLP